MKVFLFDWNGTIVNDMPYWYEAVRKIFTYYGKTVPSINDIYGACGGDYKGIYERAGITASREELHHLYRHFYGESLDTIPLMPYAYDVLTEIRFNDKKVYLITTQDESLTRPLLEKYGLTHLFSGLHFHVKNKTAVIKEICRKTGFRNWDVCYVGDTPSDMRFAKEAGVMPIAFASGHIGESLLLREEPAALIRDWRVPLHFV